MNVTWHWQTHTEHPYLTTALLEQWQHGFFTRQSWPMLPETLSQTLHPTAKVYRAKQVHGKHILNPHDFLPTLDESGEAMRPEADGVMTLDAAQAAWVCTADCTPALIADQRTGQVAAVHAGWRGTALRILPEAIAKMQAHGSRLEDVCIAMGPAIAGEVYQVSTQVAAEVGRSLLTGVSEDVDVLRQLQTMKPLAIFPDAEPGRIRLDVRHINALQLLQLGITESQMAIAPHCTYQESEHFFSYRRVPEKKVQWSGIVSN